LFAANGHAGSGASIGAIARARGAHLRLGATLSKAARSAGSRLWKKDFREGWNPPGEEGFFFAALPSTSPWRRFALDPNAGIFASLGALPGAERDAAKATTRAPRSRKRRRLAVRSRSTDASRGTLDARGEARRFGLSSFANWPGPNGFGADESVDIFDDGRGNTRV
jgi:hypothetical protein